MRYSSVNSNRTRSCAKVISMLSFSSLLLIWSRSACQPSNSTWHNFSVLQVVAGLSSTFSLGNCLHQDPYQQGCLQPFAGELWGWQWSVFSSFSGRCKLMLTTVQTHFPNQGKPGSHSQHHTKLKVTCPAWGFISCQHDDGGEGQAQAKRVWVPPWDCLEAYPWVQVPLQKHLSL